MKFVFTSIFKATTIVATLNTAIERDAANGRINAMFRNMLADAYGVAMPAAPVAFANAVNAMRAAPTMDRFDQRGDGAVKGAKQVHEALAAMVTAIVEAGKVSGMPALSDTPKWLQAPAPKAKAEKAESAPTADSTEDGAESDAPADSSTPTPTVADNAQEHIIAVIALAKAGALTADQKGALLQALEGCAVVNAPMPKRARKAKPEAATA